MTVNVSFSFFIWSTLPLCCRYPYHSEIARWIHKLHQILSRLSRMSETESSRSDFLCFWKFGQTRNRIYIYIHSLYYKSMSYIYTYVIWNHLDIYDDILYDVYSVIWHPCIQYYGIWMYTTGIRYDTYSGCRVFQQIKTSQVPSPGKIWSKDGQVGETPLQLGLDDTPDGSSQKKTLTWHSPFVGFQ